MSDRELWDAIGVIARRMGLLERGQRLEIAGDPRDVPTAELCRRVGEHKGVRLLCNYARGHADAAGVVVHSWERAMVGLSPCTNNRGPSANAPLCELPTHHAGEHAASGRDGTIWEWGDAPTSPVNAVDWNTVTLTTDSPEIRCGTKRATENPVMAGQTCDLLRGHEGEHEAHVNGQRWVFVTIDPERSRG